VRFGTARPNGYRLDRQYQGKVKMMNFTVLPPPYYAWPEMWGARYSLARNTQWVETARANGFNAIRIFTGPSPHDGLSAGVNSWPDLATFRARAREFAAMMRSKRMALNLTLASKSEALGTTTISRDAIIPGMIDYCRIWLDEASDLIVFVDAINEMNIQTPQSWGGGTQAAPNATARSDLFYYFDALRKVTRETPLTISVTTGGPGEVAGANGWFDLQYDLGCDLHDIHCYWTAAAPPTKAHFDAFEDRSKFIGKYIVSEFGNQQQQSEAQIWALNNGMADIAARPACLGIGMWCIAPQADTFSQPSNDFGFTADVAGTIVRAVKQASSVRWPNSL
jgi:hypothetical protein